MPERRLGRRAVFDAPVLMVGSVVLRDVEPYEPERAVVAHPSEQVADLRGLVGLGARGSPRQQHRLAGEDPHLRDRLAEDTGEGIGGAVVIAVDADPGDVLVARPPGGDRAGAGLGGDWPAGAGSARLESPHAR